MPSERGQALTRINPDQGFSVAGAEFEPATFGL